MSRWHKPDCTAPDIVVANPPGPPSCKTCGSTPNLDEIIRQQAHESPFPAPPPDEPRGQMNLWWPRSVPYLNTPSKLLPTPDEHPDSVSSSLSNTPTPEIPVPAKQSPIYSARLKTGEIRLACFQASSSSPSPDAPVHLTLETYPLSNCPPYETVSYCWAGEDGDDKRLRPVYVGPYWDVMLHTRNCWELLRFVRPGRGVRLVWVDAVCIDQGCDDERAAQVAQMGRIYTLCTQVVVYLGPDVAPLLPEGQHSRRARLGDFGKGEAGADSADFVGAAHGVRELLQKRYFSRLWVVQELILSPRVVIRIGDVDFQSDGATSGQLWGKDIGDLGLAPWVRHTSRGTPLDLNFLQVMRLTFSSACADPRDRVFGVMGIISDGSQRLEPDYSLPVQHVFVGLFAHLLIVKGMKHLLALASEVPGSVSIPSWVPDWTSWDKWQAVFEPRARNPLQRALIHLRVDALKKALKNRLSRGTNFNLVTVLLPLRYCRQTDPLCQEATFGIDPTKGALRAKMIRVLGLGSMPKFVSGLYPGDPMLFEVRYGNHSLYLTSWHRLNIVVQPGNDDLYLYALEEESRTPGVCILRRTAGSSGNTVRLVGTCEVALFSLTANPPAVGRPDSSSFSILKSLLEKSPFPWPNRQLDDIDSRPPWVGDLYWTLSEVITWGRTWLDAPVSPDEQLLFLPLFNSKRRDMLPFYLALIHADGEVDAVVNTYKQYVVERCSAEFWQGRFFFTLAIDDPNTLIMDKEHRLILTQLDWDVAVRDFCSNFRLESTASSPCRKTATIAFQDGIVRQKLSGLSANRCFYMIQAAARMTGESVEQLLFRNTTDADRLVRVPIHVWAERLMDEFGCDGSVEYVNIV